MNNGVVLHQRVPHLLRAEVATIAEREVERFERLLEVILFVPKLSSEAGVELTGLLIAALVVCADDGTKLTCTRKVKEGEYEVHDGCRFALWNFDVHFAGQVDQLGLC